MTLFTVIMRVVGLNFNSHAHVERDLTTQIANMTTKNFNSHAHVERDKLAIGLSSAIPISTHTLTWSVTGKSYTYIDLCEISTHTLTWSVTIQTKIKRTEIFIISTHTLTWSVTLYSLWLCSVSSAFQLTRSRGA